MPFETSYSDRLQQRVGFVLMLSDAFTRSESLMGDIVVNTGRITAVRRSDTGVFIFPELPPGDHLVEIRSGRWTPFYLRAEVSMPVPSTSALWPAYPDLNLADPDLPLDDPAQPLAYRQQRESSRLRPSTAYPFDSGATLVRGTVLNGNDPLPDALVEHPGGDEIAYTTGGDGQFVLFFPRMAGLVEDVILRVTRPGFPDQDVPVTLIRGGSVSVTVNM